jgi:hypothetical protein
VGTDQAVSRARLTIVRLMRQKPCCQRCRDLSLAAALYQFAIRRWVQLSAPAAVTANEKALTKPMRGAETAEATQPRLRTRCLGPLADLAALEKGIDVALSLRPLKAIFRHHLRDQIIPTF